MSNTYYLKHHGIKGQKWGVRNGPPYPIEDKVLKKGTRVNSVSGTYLFTDEYLKSGRPIYTYNADDDWDNKVYKGPFTQYLVQTGARFIREHEFETTEDLRMADSKERFSEFKNLLDDKHMAKTTIRDLTEVQDMIRRANSPSMKEMADLDLDNLKTAKDYQTAYKIFNHAMEAAHEFESTTQYIKNIAKKYDAMVDDNNVNIYNKAHDPIIFFKPAKFLKDVGDQICPKFLTVEEVLDNSDYVEKELNKIGEKLKF